MHHPVLQSWLQLQTTSLGPTRAASVRLENHCLTPRGTSASSVDQDNPMSEVADPDNWFAAVTTQASDGEGLDELLSVATKSRALVVAKPDNAVDSSIPVLRIAQPIELQGKVCGAVAVELEDCTNKDQDKVVRLLQWGAAWLDLLLTHSQAPETATPGASQVLWQHELPALLQCVADSDSVQHAFMSVSCFLTHRLGLDYVAIGERADAVFSLNALSDSATVSAQSEIAERLTAQMQQTMDALPAAEPHNGDDSDEHHNETVLLEDEAIGVALNVDYADAIVLIAQPRQHERATLQVRDALEVSARLLGPALALKWQQERSVVQRVRQRLSKHRSQETSQRIVRPLVTVLIGLVALVLLVSQVPYRISGDAVVEGAIQRAVIAPFDGYIAAAHSRAGERVEAGVVLAELDDKDIRLRLRQLQGDKAEIDKNYRKALAGFDNAEAKILEAQLEQVHARIEQINEQLVRTQLTVPFDGTVVSGDLSRSLGKPVERGEILFEVAPLDHYRVAVNIRDRDVSAIEVGQQGTLVLAALSSNKLDVVVENVARLSDDGQNPGTFRIEARLDGDIKTLRPGMRGIAKIQVGQRSRWWIWTHGLTDWLRYQAWQWMP